MSRPYIEDVPLPTFDSSIDHPAVSEDHIHFDYIIVLRVYLAQLNPPDGKRTFNAPDHNGTLWPALRWDQASWVHFVQRYKMLATNLWDKAFLLIPPSYYKGFLWPEGDGEPRSLLCRLRIKILDTYKTAHAQVAVVRLATPNRSYFRSDSALYDSGDATLQRMRYSPAGVSFLHNTPAHEVGHLLGLADIGVGKEEACKDESDSACYGSNLSDRLNVMGAGGMLDLFSAEPWLKRIKEHVPSVGREAWKVIWASNEAATRGFDGFKMDGPKTEPPASSKRVAPGLIDL